MDGWMARSLARLQAQQGAPCVRCVCAQCQSEIYHYVEPLANVLRVEMNAQLLCNIQVKFISNVIDWNVERLFIHSFTK